VQFAQLAGNLPEDALEDLLMAHALQQDGVAPQQQGGMPGGLPGEILLEFPDEVDDGDPLDAEQHGGDAEIRVDDGHVEGQLDEEDGEDDDEGTAVSLSGP